MSNVELRTRVVGPWSLNTYALVFRDTGLSVLVDPGAEPEALIEILAESQPVAILVTHTHVDHIGALAEMRARLSLPVMLHGGPHADNVDIRADRWLKDGDIVQVGAHHLKIYYAPGHTADQICIVPEGSNIYVVGDTIFEGGPGKTSSPQNFQTTLGTLRDVVLHWPDNAICYPGHGACFRIRDKRLAIEEFLRRDHGDFFGDATWEMGA